MVGSSFVPDAAGSAWEDELGPALDEPAGDGEEGGEGEVGEHMVEKALEVVVRNRIEAEPGGR